VSYNTHVGLREEFNRRIEKKQQEITDLEWKLREGRAYLQGLQDSLRLLPKDSNMASSQPEPVLRPGSVVARARDAIRTAGQPQHITQLITALGRPNDKKNRLALAGTIAAYARKGQIFVRTAPNTFGLIGTSTAVGPTPATNGERQPMPDEIDVEELSFE
jgi:hypothetical protein